MKTSSYILILLFLCLVSFAGGVKVGISDEMEVLRTQSFDVAIPALLEPDVAPVVEQEVTTNGEEIEEEGS